jgi:hypothetical protein
MRQPTDPAPLLMLRDALTRSWEREQRVRVV